jgi:site-specific DNA-methyltransferase (adenine-specific)
VSPPHRARVQIPTSPEWPTVVRGDSLKVLRSFEDNTFDSIVADPPFEVGFTRNSGRGWDASGIAFSTQLWAEALRVLKPGGNLFAFGAPRTFHRLVVAVEDSGFEIRHDPGLGEIQSFPKIAANLEPA